MHRNDSFSCAWDAAVEDASRTKLTRRAAEQNDRIPRVIASPLIADRNAESLLSGSVA